MKPSNASPAFSGISILCIDNHIDSLEILRVTLQLEGANVLTATSAREALFSLKQSSVDVVLCDLRMPDENGVETLHKLRAAGFEGPAIALTAIRNAEVEAEVLKQGFAAYLTKPVEIDELVAAIADLPKVQRKVS
jgi:two-component system, OmpR family, response regulator